MQRSPDGAMWLAGRFGPWPPKLSSVLATRQAPESPDGGCLPSESSLWRQKAHAQLAHVAASVIGGPGGWLGFI
jgi:hypothetical protein